MEGQDAGRVLADDQVIALKERFKTEKLPTLEEVYLTLRKKGKGQMAGP